MRNSNNEFYYVNQHYREQILAERRELQVQLKQIKEDNKTLSPERQVKAVLKYRSLFINNES